MSHPHSTPCDDFLLDRYLDEDLGADEKARMEIHMAGCRQCRGQAAVLSGFSQDLRDRVQQAADSVDFVALEKQVLTKALRLHRSRGGRSGFVATLKFTVPAALTAGLLLFFAYANYLDKPVPAPSAIINSFTGSMSSVMIFETPETRQTILWYNEDTDVESEQNSV